MRKIVIVGVLLLMFLCAPASAAEFSVEYPESVLVGEWLELKVTSDEPLSQVSAVVTVAGTSSPVSMFQVDERTFRVAFVPPAEEPGSLTFHITALTESGELHTLPAESPEASPFQVALLEDTVAPDFVMLRSPQRIAVDQLATFVFLVPAASGSVDPATVEVSIDGEPARAVSVAANLILVEHVFTEPGRRRVEVRGADRWGNEGSRTFEVSVRRPSLLQTRFSVRTDASAALGSSQPASVVTRLDGYAKAGSLVLQGHAGYPLAGNPLSSGYGLQAEWSPLRFLRFKGNLGEFTADSVDLVLNTRVQDGFGIEAGLGLLQGAYYSGVVRQSTGTDEKGAVGEKRYERNVLGVSSGLGSFLTIGGALVSDRYLDACTLDANGCALSSKARANAVIGADVNLGLLGFQWGNSVAASLDVPRIARAVPYTGGPLLLGTEEVNEQTQITPSDIFSKAHYEKFPIPQFTLTELLDTTNPAVVPGVAYRSKLTFPQLLGVRIEGAYAYADSGFDSLVAAGPKGEETLSAKLSYGRGRSLRLVVEGEDSRKVEKNLFLDALLSLATSGLDLEEDSEAGGESGGDSEGAVESLARTQELSVSLSVPLRLFTLRPVISYEIRGEQEFGPSESLLSKGVGSPIPDEDRESSETRVGARIENFRLGSFRFGAGYFRTTGIEYAGGVAQDPVLGNTVELEAQTGPYHVEFSVDEEPVAEQRSRRFGASWNGEFVSVGVGLDQLYTAGDLDERRLELNISAYYPHDGGGILGGGANYAMVEKSGGEASPVGSVYLYHQWNF